MRSRLGVVTIGQAPRTDLTPEMRAVMPDVELVEYGALDELDAAEIGALAPEDSDEVLVTLLRDGSGVRVSHARIEPLVQAAIGRAETDDVAATLVVCTGSFGALKHQRTLLFAENLLVHGVVGLNAGQQLGVVCPDPAQRGSALAKWTPHTGEPLTSVASPYTADATGTVATAAADLVERGAAGVVLDCMGYTETMRGAARQHVAVPVILARSLVARVAGEIVA